jgi:hypothetical protein
MRVIVFRLLVLLFIISLPGNCVKLKNIIIQGPENKTNIKGVLP